MDEEKRSTHPVQMRRALTTAATISPLALVGGCDGVAWPVFWAALLALVIAPLAPLLAWAAAGVLGWLRRELVPTQSERETARAEGRDPHGAAKGCGGCLTFFAGLGLLAWLVALTRGWV